MLKRHSGMGLRGQMCRCRHLTLHIARAYQCVGRDGQVLWEAFSVVFGL